MVTEVIAPQIEEHRGKDVNLKEYYYDNHKVILGLAVALQVCLIGNLFVFFQGVTGFSESFGKISYACNHDSNDIQ